MKKFLIFLFSALNIIAHAQNSVEVLPLRDNILMIHVDEGYIVHHKQGESNDQEYAVVQPLDVETAKELNSYSISSSDDDLYAIAKNPIDINRKSKPTDFASLCQGWDGSCVNTDIDHAKEHYIYLHLPSSLKANMNYTIDLSSIGFDEISFQYSDRVLRSEAVHVNIIGYVPDAEEKFGYVYHWMGDGGSMNFEGLENNSFFLVGDSDNQVKFQGTIRFRKSSSNQEFAYTNESPNGNLIGAEVYDCDFSSFNEEGSYRLCVEGVGCSFPFEIGENVYYEPWEYVQNGLYQQRSGIALEAPYTDMPRPADHNPLETPGFAGKLLYTNKKLSTFIDSDADPMDKAAIDAEIVGPLDVYGWYQDAGDWDGYFRHTEVPHLLLWLYEMHADRFTDGQLNLPENNNGIPDLLDEALWLPRFYQRLRAEMASKGYGNGGVGGSRIFGDLWGEDTSPEGFLRGSWEDTTREWIVSGEDPFMTFQYAAMAAQIAYLEERFSIVLDDNVDWKTEAISSYQIALDITTDEDEFMFDYPLYEIRIHASAELYRLTKEGQYLDAFKNDWSTFGDSDVYGNVIFWMTAMQSALAETNDDPLLNQALQSKIYDAASFELSFARDDRACRWGGNFWFPMLVGQGTTPMIVNGIFGHYLARKNNDVARIMEYEGAIYSTADYFLGNNPLNMTWITRLGERYPNEIFNLDSWALGGDTPRRGLIPYGPWRSDGGLGANGPWNHMWASEYIYPESIDQWPGHERYFDQRPSPLSTEYTVNQNLGPAIFTYGYLFGLNAEAVVTSTDEKEILSDVNISPNPVSDILQIQKDHKDLHQTQIISSLGEVVYFSNKDERSINVSQLTPGVYFLVVSNDDFTKSNRVRFVKI